MAALLYLQKGLQMGQLKDKGVFRVNRIIEIHENDINMIIEVTEEMDARLLHFSCLPWDGAKDLTEEQKSTFRITEISFTGENQICHRGVKHTGTLPGHRFKFVDYKDCRNEHGRIIHVLLKDDVTSVKADITYQFYNEIPVVRTWTEIKNEGNESVGLEYITSFALGGIDRGGHKSRNEKMKIYIPHNEWCGEANWKEYSLSDLGIEHVEEESTKKILVSNTGNWSTCQYAPMAYIENTETGNGIVWQIEHDGSWNWEISDIKHMLYLQAGGPSEYENHFWKDIKPGQSFVTVPAAAGCTHSGIQAAVEVMTKYRRRIRRQNKDNEKLPVIFNDYMNCLSGDPTTEKLIPLIDAAAKAGCEYFCIDCGWYSDGYWWDGVGEWLPSEKRFPGGIEEPLKYIRDKGMIPGLWLEIEVMGINCPLADKLPDSWFFMRHGKRIIDHLRYQLDFRNPEVRNYASKVIRRLVKDYGAGYIKMDYNINMGIGTDYNADSAGDGLFGHNRAYLEWIDEVFREYPDLVIENCSSGGMRLDYAMLSRHSIQSVSDQTDYRKNAVIAAAAPSLASPEQCAIWSYPLRDGDKEEVIFNMVNAMLMRIHQSGHLAEISRDNFELVKKGIEYYKEIRSDIKEGIPFWPMGFPHLEDEWISLGLRCSSKVYLALWKLKGVSSECSIHIEELAGKDVSVECGYPENAACKYSYNNAKGILEVNMDKDYRARIFEFTLM